jgi:hypothetical protein
LLRVTPLGQQVGGDFNPFDFREVETQIVAAQTPPPPPAPVVLPPPVVVPTPAVETTTTPTTTTALTFSPATLTAGAIRLRNVGSDTTWQALTTPGGISISAVNGTTYSYLLFSGWQPAPGFTSTGTVSEPNTLDIEVFRNDATPAYYRLSLDITVDDVTEFPVFDAADSTGIFCGSTPCP